MIDPAPRPRSSKPASGGAWAMIVAATKIGAAMFWGVPAKPIVVSSGEATPPAAADDTRKPPKESDAVTD